MSPTGRSIARETDCLFCRWFRSGRALRTPGTVAAFADGYPVTDGHVLIVPLRRTADGLSMTREEVRDSEALIRALAASNRRDDPTVTGFNIGMNIGRSVRPSCTPTSI